jgi:DNA polymerase phi
VSSAQAISLLLRSSQTSKSNKGQENRDFLFARLFGLTAIVNSGALFATTANIDDFRVVTGELVGLGRRKGWLKESAWYTLISAVEGLLASEASWAEEALTEVIDKAYGREAEGGWSSEKVALTLLLEQKRPVSAAISAGFPADLAETRMEDPSSTHIQAHAITT